MMSFVDLLVVIGMALLRFGVPLALMGGAVYLLKRLDRRWEEEARAGEQPPAKQPGEQPAAPTRTPAQAPELPFIIPPAKQPGREQIGLSMAAPMAPDRPVAKSSGGAQKVACATPNRPGAPCWQARLDAEGKVPDECVECDVFQRYPPM